MKPLRDESLGTHGVQYSASDKGKSVRDPKFHFRSIEFRSRSTWLLSDLILPALCDGWLSVFFGVLPFLLRIFFSVVFCVPSTGRVYGCAKYLLQPFFLLWNHIRKENVT